MSESYKYHLFKMYDLRMVKPGENRASLFIDLVKNGKICLIIYSTICTQYLTDLYMIT